jgi:hypothetical protein
MMIADGINEQRFVAINRHHEWHASKNSFEG